MPREQREWSMQQSIEDSEQGHAQQSCTYSSIINVNKSNYPFSSSYEHEQTWTLTRTMSNHHKRYQSVIENIHLMKPNVINENQFFKKIPLAHRNSDQIKLVRDRSISLIPTVLPSRKRISSSTRSISDAKSNELKQKKSSRNNDFTLAKPLTLKISPPIVKPMRVIHANGELVIRI